MQNRYPGYKDITSSPKKTIAEETSSLHKSNFTHSGCSISIITFFLVGVLWVVNSPLSVQTIKPAYWAPSEDVSSSIVNALIQDTYGLLWIPITNSSGISETIKDFILWPFFTTKKGTEGTGLGLSITHDFVKAQEAELKITSEKDQGARFSIFIPPELNKRIQDQSEETSFHEKYDRTKNFA